MLNDSQSLILCGILAGGIFITGVLGILDNFIVLTILTIVFISIIVNIYLTRHSSKNEELESEE